MKYFTSIALHIFMFILNVNQKINTTTTNSNNNKNNKIKEYYSLEFTGEIFQLQKRHIFNS